MCMCPSREYFLWDKWHKGRKHQISSLMRAAVTSSDYNGHFLQFPHNTGNIIEVRREIQVWSRENKGVLFSIALPGLWNALIKLLKCRMKLWAADSKGWMETLIKTVGLNMLQDKQRCRNRVVYAGFLHISMHTVKTNIFCLINNFSVMQLLLLFRHDVSVYMYWHLHGRGSGSRWSWRVWSADCSYISISLLVKKKTDISIYTCSICGLHSPVY